MPTVTHVVPHVRIAFGGVIGSPAVEEWTCALAWGPSTDDAAASLAALTVPELAQQNAGLSAAISQWFSSSINGQTSEATGGAGIGQAAFLTWMKLNRLDNLGHYIGASNTFAYPAPVPGGGTVDPTGPAGAYIPPWQMSTVLTLLTDVSRGRGSHGRLYPPLAGSGPSGTTPYQTAHTVQCMAASLAGLISNINENLFSGSSYAGNDAGGFQGNVVISSSQPNSGPNAGAAPFLTVVRTVVADRVADIQKRRVEQVSRLLVAPVAITNIDA